MQCRPLLAVLRGVGQQSSPSSLLRPRPLWLDNENMVFLVLIYAAFVEVNSAVPATGTLATVNEVETTQTSATVLTVQFSYSPLGLDRNIDHNNDCLLVVLV